MHKVLCTGSFLATTFHGTLFKMVTINIQNHRRELAYHSSYSVLLNLQSSQDVLDKTSCDRLGSSEINPAKAVVLLVDDAHFN